MALQVRVGQVGTCREAPFDVCVHVHVFGNKSTGASIGYGRGMQLPYPGSRGGNKSCLAVLVIMLLKYSKITTNATFYKRYYTYILHIFIHLDKKVYSQVPQVSCTGAMHYC